VESARTHGTQQGRAKAGQTKTTNTKRALVVRLIEVVEDQYRRTGSGMGVQLMHLKKVASPQTIRKHFPNGIPEIASEAVRILAASKEPINPHLDALASMFLASNPATTRSVLIGLRISRIPAQPAAWSSDVHAEVIDLLKSLDDPRLSPPDRARLNYLAAQHHTKVVWDHLYPDELARRFPTPPPKASHGSDRTAQYLESARDLYLRAQEPEGALLAHIELRNHRIFNIHGDPDLTDIHALYRDCIAMRSADVHVAAAVWIQLQEALYARSLGFSDASINEIFTMALSEFHDVPVQDFRTYPMDEIRKIFLLASQVGAVTVELMDSIPKEAVYAIGTSWLSTIRGASLAPRGDTLSPASLILLKNVGIAQTYYRTKEFRLLLQTHLGLSIDEVEDAFDRFELDRAEDFDNATRFSEADKALDELGEAVARLHAAPQVRHTWKVQDVIRDLRILQDDWDVTGRHRSPFEPKVTVPRTGDDAKDSLDHLHWSRRHLLAELNAARVDERMRAMGAFDDRIPFPGSN
jgi:hypothetical protein